MRTSQASFPSIQKSLREISPIAAEARRLEAHFDDRVAQQGRDEKLQAAYKKRLQLVQEFQSAGLVVSAVKFKGDDREDLVYEDLSAHDDGGKLIETFLHVPAFTKDQVAKVYEIAERNQLGVMTVGAKTSALGVFAAWDMAKMRGLKGVICLDMPACWDSNQTSAVMNKTGMPEPLRQMRPSDLLQLPAIDASQERMILSDSLPVAVIQKRDELPGTKHRVVAHATVTVAQINAFLEEILPKDAHYQILPDLTSKEQAALGGVIATGAQGGNRTSARVDLLSCQVVDALGVRDLHGEDAKMIVGYNGYLGNCVQAEFEVTKFPKHPFGFMVPIRGKTIAEAWQNALKFQARLAPHCVHPDQLVAQPENMRHTLISSMEILGPEQLRLGIEKYKGRSEDLQVLLQQYPGTQMFVYVTGSTHLGHGGELDLEWLLKDAVFADTLQTQTGPQDDLGEAFDGSLIKVRKGDQLPHENVYPLLEPQLLKLVDAIRHSAPEVARAEAEKIGNVTQSTDFNIQFTGSDEEQERARAKVAALYAKYQERFSKGPYRVDVYGHLFPGIVESPKGGGMDPHIRVTLNLSDPDTRNDSPERVNDMKAILGSFYVELLRLHGEDGIVVAPPEKSHLTNLSYVKWVRLHNPGMIYRLQERFLNGHDEAGRNKRMLDGFRVPVEFPAEPRRGMRSFLPSHLLPPEGQEHDLGVYADAILEISQLSHRGPEIKGMFREVVATLREKLKLHPFRQHPFFIESVEEGRKIIERNLGEQDEFHVQEITQRLDLEQLEEGTFDAKTFYLIPAEHLGGIPGMCVMITPHKAILKADERKQSGENKEVFRNLVEMFQYYPYETPETPNIPAVVALGLALQCQELAQQKGAEMDPIVTINPGPTQLHPHIRQVVKEKGFLQSTAPEEQQSDIQAFRKFMRIPEDMKLGFTGSATQCMQLLGEALGQRKDQVHVIQLVNGAFAERMQKILGSHGLKVSALRIPWTTTASSQSEFVANEFVELIEQGIEKGKKPIVFVTPHETSTGAHFHPESLIAQLRQRGLQIEKDYELVCDITSGAGAVDYFTEACQKGMSVFGSDQKALGCPAGLGFFALSRELSRTFHPYESGEENGLVRSLRRSENGSVQNPFALRMLGEKSRHELAQERTVVHVSEEVRKRINTIFAFMLLHPGLCPQVPAAEDQSNVMASIFTLIHGLPNALQIIQEIFGYRLGSGYGPFANESMRLYLATISSEKLDKILSALHVVLKMPEVTKTVNPKAPLVSLREPHDSLQVLKNLVTNPITPDGLFRDHLGLGWIRRLQYTYELGKDTPYGSDENFDEIRRILDCELPGRQKLLDVYEDLESKIDRVKEIVLEGDEIRQRSVDSLIANMYPNLCEIIMILERYAKTAPRIEDAPTKIKWPLAGTPEQFKKNGNGHANGNGVH